ncbi:MAG: S8 family serine peptidase [Silvanigrellaceae bacterium]
MRVLPLAIALVVGSLQWGAQAANIGIVDSGLDIKHPSLAQRTWTNPGEIPANNLDDEQDGYIDDLHGWNFVENNGLLLDPKYLNTFPPETSRFFEIQKKLLEGTATDDDKSWLKDNLQNNEFRKKLAVFGNFVHGTHVAGISARKNIAAELIGIKLIPTENPLAPESVHGIGDNAKAARRFLTKVWDTVWPVVRDAGIKAGLSKLAEIQSSQFIKVALYLNDKKADVANYSLGVSTAAAGNIVKPLLKALFGREPTQEEVTKYASFLVGKFAENATKWASLAPNTLLVMAAGNDGSDNDLYPASPANARAANTITVAATQGRGKLAVFSNYGRQMVDVAAPGVGILSTMPGGGELVLSGTSQAAPYVSQVAGAIKDENPDLSVHDLKRIILGTVDKRDWLSDKVSSSGIVNRDRAVHAAQLSHKMTVAQAIAQATKEIPDLETPYERVMSDEDESLIWAPELSLGL